MGMGKSIYYIFSQSQLEGGSKDTQFYVDFKIQTYFHDKIKSYSTITGVLSEKLKPLPF
jgi:hypothetical protein